MKCSRSRMNWYCSWCEVAMDPARPPSRARKPGWLAPARAGVKIVTAAATRATTVTTRMMVGSGNKSISTKVVSSGPRMQPRMLKR